MGWFNWNAPSEGDERHQHGQAQIFTGGKWVPTREAEEQARKRVKEARSPAAYDIFESKLSSKLGKLDGIILSKEQRREHEARNEEEDLDYAGAIKIWESLGNRSEAKRIRLKMREEEKVKVDQTVVHGDYVDDRDTIIKDSVISKSSVGAGGKSKSEELRDAKALLDDGIIDDDEFKQMKKEILGK
jgi:hypothetical protein